MITERSEAVNKASRQFPMGLLAAVGTLLGVVTLAYLIDHPVLIEHPYSPLVRRAEIIAVICLSGSVVAAAYRLTGSRYSVPDLWAIFGWSVAGLLGSVGVAGGIYLHQTLRGGSLADKMFLFEELALVGLVAGLGFGVTRRATVPGHAVAAGPTREMETRTSTVDASTLITALSDDSEGITRRLAVLEQLVVTTTHELPLAALAVKLAGEEITAFPDDEHAVARLLEQTDVPALVDAGLAQVNADIETVEYVGPPELAESLSQAQSRSRSQSAPAAETRP
jgi:hypothetical protein